LPELMRCVDRRRHSDVAPPHRELAIEGDR
jgi:hypothetical protein